ncbi:hypothetical protein JRO89_XSUnG0150700 [Xanthoceras sorbifolium]|uniref:ERBB-3 BINDING PROTEIN 1 n=1 Tax=Xanthoceras sorbifolium TaxID=99658 RepID=A0ABQ8GXX8_9ROSI|nr:hypothetical protein JRO89_XSUnG0150700 [Xanthoceras sorbifolium]
MSDEEAEVEERELDLSTPDVVTKYKTAADIVNSNSKSVLSFFVASKHFGDIRIQTKAKIVDIWEKGDAFIREQAGNMYKNVKKKIERGVAFPTYISVNNTVCHFSPLASDETILEEDGPVTGRAADVIAAANTAAEVALRLVRPRRKNKDVTDAIQKVATAYDCKIVEGVLSHQLKQFVIDGNKVVLSVSSPETRVDDAEFEENEVYAVDIVISAGDGKPKLLDERETTIYKRAVDTGQKLSLEDESFKIHLQALEEKRARLGLVECVNHDLLLPYPVLREKPGLFYTYLVLSDHPHLILPFAHIKFTVLLMPNGSDRVTSHPLQELQPTKTIDDDPEIKSWLARGIKTKKKGCGKKKNGKKGDKAEESADVESTDATTNVSTQE